MDSPIQVTRIHIQGVKGILEPIIFDCGKASHPVSLAVFAPNGCGKSGIADAIEYFFDDQGIVEHLGAATNCETGGKAAFPNIKAKERKIDPSISISFAGGDFAGIKTISRTVSQKRDDPAPADVVTITNKARAHRILRQHDLRRFVVDYAPADKYGEVSRWVGLELLDKIQGVLTTAQNDFAGKSVDQAIQERKKDLGGITNNKLHNFADDALLAWINDDLLQPLNAGLRLKQIDGVEELYGQLDALQKAEDGKTKKAAYDSFLTILKPVHKQGKPVPLKLVTIKEKLNALRSSWIAFETARDQAKDSIFKDVWESVSRMLEMKKDLAFCPVCGTALSSTEHRNHDGLAQVIKNNLSALKGVQTAQTEVQRKHQEVSTTIMEMETELSSIEKAGKDVNILADATILQTTRKYITDTKPKLTQATVKSSADLLSESELESGIQPMLSNIERMIASVTTKIEKLSSETLDGDRFRNAKTKIEKLSTAKTRYEELIRTQEEHTKISESFANIVKLIKESIKEQMTAVLKAMQSDIETIYKKIHKGRQTPSISVQIPEEKDRALLLRISFYDLEELVPPGGYLSEAYINTLGIAIFLASIRLFNTSFPFVVLDDIVSSYDADHRALIVDLLAEDFTDCQFILTTHDHNFFQMLRSRLEGKNWKFMKIKNWNVDTGPLLEGIATGDQEVESLFADKTRFHEAGNCVRFCMEEWFDKVCDEFQVFTPHKRGTHDYKRTLYDFWNPFVKRIYDFGADVKAWLESQVCFQRLNGSSLINHYSHYQANPYEWPNMGDVEYIWGNFKELRSLFVCEFCLSRLKHQDGNKKPFCPKCARGTLPPSSKQQAPAVMG